ncbi:uncharacterized protein N7484_010435, partial [Penicillium longicatenatum]|uniref:uncharacterized protein n=1 Tax=Penicillium longicatenatum TaxID=1561947 RepID=UPI0025484BE0
SGYFNNDITGVGVVINYIVGAGIAVVITIIYYFFVYQPSQDPYGRTDENAPAFNANPVDELFLTWLRRWPKRLLTHFRPCWGETRISNRLERIFVKCLLAMSDFQLVTGFSILISGASQLRCGLTTLYWVFIMELAWLSCFTHLVCLTLLRKYLYHHASERLWRLIAMGTLVVFVVTGLFCELTFYSNYNYDDSDAAICYIGLPILGSRFSSDAWAVLISALVIMLGFVARVVKLHRPISNAFDRTRSWLSLRGRKVLSFIYEQYREDCRPQTLRLSLLYRPLLAAFLTARFLLDTLTSVFCEVAWLCAAFSWGVSNVVRTFDSLSRETSNSVVESRMSDWTFGQVISVVLLAAPLLAIIEYFSSGKSEVRTTIESFLIVNPSSINQTPTKMESQR